MHEYIEGICELKMRALEELANYGRKGEFSRGELPTIDTLAHTAKNLCKIIEMCEETTGYSFGGRMNMRGNYSYNDGASYRRGGYSNEGSSNRGGNYSNEGMSYRGRYSNAMGRYSNDNDWLMDTLNELKEKSGNERMRAEFDEFISRMERMK